MGDTLLLAEVTTDELRALLATPPVVALLPVGSTEPHGPHLPLGTDQAISQGACERAAVALRARGIFALVAPGVPYGVTDFARGFAGAVSVPPAALVPFVRAVVEGLLGEGFSHVCVVNNHLEPAHDAAIRDAASGLGHRASVACPLTRRWGRTLTAEFKSGACHAGQYETSLVAAVAPALVRAELGRALPDVSIHLLPEGIKSHRTSFVAMGIQRAYTGAPRAASAEEGEASLARLAEMVVTEVVEHLAASTPSSPGRGPSMVQE